MAPELRCIHCGEVSYVDYEVWCDYGGDPHCENCVQQCFYCIAHYCSLIKLKEYQGEKICEGCLDAFKYHACETARKTGNREDLRTYLILRRIENGETEEEIEAEYEKEKSRT